MTIRYSEQYDAYYDDETNQWLESLCKDPDCEYCMARPTFPKKMNIMSIASHKLSEPNRYYIDCPIDTWDDKYGNTTTEYRRIEIPRELALYVRQLQEENEKLKAENKKRPDQ